MILAVALGAALGAEARYGLSVMLPHRGADFPWSTLLVNISGCALMGILMVCVRDLSTPHRLTGPFLGTGVLGGFTTFSTYAVDVVQLLDRGRTGIAVAYFAGTVTAALLAVWIATVLTRAGLARRGPHRPGRDPTG